MHRAVRYRTVSRTRTDYTAERARYPFTVTATATAPLLYRTRSPSGQEQQDAAIKRGARGQRGFGGTLLKSKDPPGVHHGWLCARVRHGAPPPPSPLVRPGAAEVADGGVGGPRGRGRNGSRPPVR
eukprot:4880744-Pyramimonas_sp.AAC.1